MLDALAARTGNLRPAGKPIPDSMEAAYLLANDSASAMINGVFGAAVGAIERALRALRRDGHDPDLFLTGGDAKHISQLLGEAAKLRPNMVLEGLACLAEHSR